MKKNYILLSCLLITVFSLRVNAQINENFDGGVFPPTGWTQEYVSAAVDWVGNNGNNNGSVATAHSGAVNAMFYSGNYNGDATKLVSPSMDLTVLGSAQLEFWYTQVDWTGDQDVFTVYYKTSAAGPWVALTSYSNSVSTWTRETIALPNISNDYYVAFEATADWGYGVTIDDVTVMAPPSCLDPSALTATNITTTTADLSWTENGTATLWDIEVGLGSFTPTGTPTNAGVTNPISVSTLTGATTYDYYVRADCGAGDFSTWVGPFTFTTSCPIFIPNYLEPFNSFVPVCWDEADDGTPLSGPTGVGVGSWNEDGFLNVGTTGGVSINLWSNSKSDWILSPEFDLSTGGPYELKIEAGLTEWDGTAAINMGSDDSVQVLVSVDGGTNWLAIYTWDVNNQPSNTGGFVSIDLSAYNGTSNLFAIWGSEGTVDDAEDMDFHIGSFEIRNIPTCLEPSTLAAANITATSADLSWTENGTATLWDIEIGTAGFSPTGTPTNVGTTNPIAISTLTAATTYDYYVRADCGAGDFSTWVGPFSFSTPCSSYNVPWSEGFESITVAGEFPPCVTSTPDFTTGIAADTYNRGARTGTNYLYTRWIADDWFFTAGINLTAGTSYDFSAWYNTDGNTGWDTVSLWVGSDQTALTMNDSLTAVVDSINMTYQELRGAFVPASSGIYYFGIHVEADGNPWYISFDDLLVELSGSAINEFTNDSFTVYPNPNNGTFTIVLGENVEKNTSISIIDMQGRVVYISEQPLTDGLNTISLGDVEKGIYLVSITSTSGRFTQSIVVE